MALAKASITCPIRDMHMRHAMDALWLPPGLSEEERSRRLQWATEAVRHLNPLDEAEAMLAVQMVSAHTAAMECLRKATQPGADDEITRDITRALRFMRLYTEQVKALNHHRGQGRRTVIRPVFADSQDD